MIGTSARPAGRLRGGRRRADERVAECVDRARDGVLHAADELIELAFALQLAIAGERARSFLHTPLRLVSLPCHASLLSPAVETIRRLRTGLGRARGRPARNPESRGFSRGNVELWRIC